MNFWGYLIQGAIQILQWVLSELPPGHVNPILANAGTTAYFAIAPVLFFVGPFISFKLFAAVIGTIISIELVKGVIAVWRLILKIIPAAG